VLLVVYIVELMVSALAKILVLVYLLASLLLQCYSLIAVVLLWILALVFSAIKFLLMLSVMPLLPAALALAFILHWRMELVVA